MKHECFTKAIKRTVEGSVEGSVESDNPILVQFRRNPELTLLGLSKALGISLRATEKRVANLQVQKKLKHVGPKKGGHWQVL